MTDTKKEENIKKAIALFEGLARFALDDSNRESAEVHRGLVLRFSQEDLKAKIADAIERIDLRLKVLEDGEPPTCGCPKQLTVEAHSARRKYLTTAMENLAPGYFDLDVREVDALLNTNPEHSYLPSLPGGWVSAAPPPFSPPRD